MKDEEQLVKLLKEKGLILATAESCTGGLIAKRITDVAGSSAVFECGIISYSNRIKQELLGVSAQTLEEHGAVSAECAREMVEGVLKLSGADLAVAVTGIAGPESDNTNKPVGIVYIAFSDNKNTLVREYRNSFSDDVRNSNRNKTADEALKIILECLL